MGLMGWALCWLLAGVIFFLSLWIVLPGPNLFFLRLAVGAPEISPLLAALGAIALLIVLGLALARHRPVPFGLAVVLTAGMVLSSLPLLQLPQAIARAEASMAAAFAHPTEAASYAPFSWPNLIRGIPPKAVRHRANIPFATPAGTSLVLDLYQPPSFSDRPLEKYSEKSLEKQLKKYPTVVAIYGGGWSTGSSAENAAFCRFLAARGYVVAAIDYRHTPAHRYPAQIEDVRTALDVLSDRADEYGIDRDRLALVGWSAGAHLAMLAAFQPSAESSKAAIPIRALVNYYGPVNLTRGYNEPPKPDPIDVRQVLLAFMGGSPDELPEAYREASPITYVESARAGMLPPSLSIYGGRDHVVEARFGRSLYDQLIASGNKAVWLEIPWAEHAFDKVFNGISNQLALHYIERFLDRTLSP